MDRNKKSVDQAKDTAMAAILILLLVLLYTGNVQWAVVAVVVLVTAMTWPSIFKPLAEVWFGLSHMMGAVVSKILLSLIFFLIVTPVGLFRRIGGADAMGVRKWGEVAGTVFVNRDHRYVADELEKPF
ncbi:MAG: hypothetical protein KKG47_05170 [Proteobacteria bacterium]|nr:hypothetical protein [Pseudomonadota bacterium]MBU1739813.1 hypothetical protein [Pseudomonadota bacterium]